MKFKKSPRRGGKASTKPQSRDWHVHVSLESKKLKVTAASVRKLVGEVLQHAEGDIALHNVSEINVVLTNDARIREINREYRKKDKATDVLSFPQFTPREVRGAKKPADLFNPYLGDLVISTETTLKQAKRFGVTPREELVRLVVHGVLHLCGYDHEKVPAREAQRMRRRERAIRSKILAPKQKTRAR